MNKGREIEELVARKNYMVKQIEFHGDSEAGENYKREVADLTQEIAALRGWPLNEAQAK